jgi:arylamine N-acetyltransferase
MSSGPDLPAYLARIGLDGPLPPPVATLHAVARALDGGRLTIVDRELTVRDRNGRADTRRLARPDERLAVLAERFGLHVPVGTRFPSPGLAA